MGDIAELAVGNEVGASLKQGRPGWDDGIGVGVTQSEVRKEDNSFVVPHRSGDGLHGHSSGSPVRQSSIVERNRWASVPASTVTGRVGRTNFGSPQSSARLPESGGRPPVPNTREPAAV